MEGNVFDLSFFDGYFDVVIMGYGLRNVIDRDKVVVEIFRVFRFGFMIFLIV